MRFKIWLEDFEDKDFNYYKNMLLGKLSLNKSSGITQELSTWEPNQLISILNGLGEFKQLPDLIQQQVIGQINSGQGTLGDLVHIMSSQFK